jgi:hypothetical protein
MEAQIMEVKNGKKSTRGLSNSNISHNISMSQQTKLVGIERI